MQSLKTEIGAEIRNAKGEVIRKTPYRKCHSLVKGFIQLLHAQIAQQLTYIIDTGGANQAGNPHASNLAGNATTETTFGIVIGSGEAAVAIDDHKLGTQLTTSIVHQTVTFAVENPKASTYRLAVSRGFLNNTGADVNVKEVGLYLMFWSSGFKICADRTLYTVSFGAGETLTLTYRITITL